MRNAFACVGLIVLAGCFTVVMVPDSELPFFQLGSTPATTLPTIVIDPGHGGNDEGAASGGLVEKDLALDVAQRVEKALKAFDFPVVLTRRSDQYVSLADRAEMGNEREGSIFVSIHFNKHAAGSVGGVETFYSATKAPDPRNFTWMGFFNFKPPETPAESGEELAAFIQTSLVLKTDLRNRGIKSRSLYVTRHVRRPAALVEAGFISNSFESVLLKSDDYRQRLAAGIAEGVLSYWRSRPAPGSSPAPADNRKLARAEVE